MKNQFINRSKWEILLWPYLRGKEKEEEEKEEEEEEKKEEKEEEEEEENKVTKISRKKIRT